MMNISETASAMGGESRFHPGEPNNRIKLGRMRNTAPTDAAEIEALETREWLESLDYVLTVGRTRAGSASCCAS